MKNIKSRRKKKNKRENNSKMPTLTWSGVKGIVHSIVFSSVIAPRYYLQDCSNGFSSASCEMNYIVFFKNCIIRGFIRIY